MSTVIARGQPSRPVQIQTITEGAYKDSPTTSSISLPENLGLGLALPQRKFFWQRSKSYDDDAIATLFSVYDDPETADKYQPRADW